MTEAADTQINQKRDAARAMLAALELVKADPSADMLSSATWNDIKAAIAAARAAGIKSEG